MKPESNQPFIINPFTLKDPQPTYYWGGCITAPNGSVVWTYSIGSLHKVTYDWVMNQPFPDKAPEIRAITSVRTLSENELQLVEEQKKVLEDI